VVDGSTYVIIFVGENLLKRPLGNVRKKDNIEMDLGELRRRLLTSCPAENFLSNGFGGVVVYTVRQDLSVCKHLNQAQGCELSFVKELYSSRRDVIMKFQYLCAHACRSANCAR
jgi:hypothetical protein